MFTHTVNYYECDRMGITHHSNYIRFMEEARIAFLDSLGCGFETMEAEGVTSPVVSLNCNYRKTTTFKDRIDIEVSLVSLSPLKLTLGYIMKVGGTVVCTAESTHCFLFEGKPVVIAERFPAIAAAERSK